MRIRFESQAEWRSPHSSRSLPFATAVVQFKRHKAVELINIQGANSADC